MTLEDPAPWSGLKPVPGLFAPDLKAPIPVPTEPAGAYGQVIEKLLEDLPLSKGGREMVCHTSTIFLLGAQEFLALSNSLIGEDPSRTRFQENATKLVRCLLVLQRQRDMAYVLHQTAEIARAERGPPARELESIRRLKDFMTPLEDCLEKLEVHRRMEAPRFAALLVHMDDLYDDASLEIQRFFAIASREIEDARCLAGDFLERLYSEFSRASFADHVLAEHEKDVEPGQGTGLLTLLPELTRVLE